MKDLTEGQGSASLVTVLVDGENVSFIFLDSLCIVGV